MRQYHLAAARVIDADSLHTYSTVGAARSTLEKTWRPFRGQRERSRPCAWKHWGMPRKQRAVRRIRRRWLDRDA